MRSSIAKNGSWEEQDGKSYFSLPPFLVFWLIVASSLRYELGRSLWTDQVFRLQGRDLKIEWYLRVWTHSGVPCNVSGICQHLSGHKAIRMTCLPGYKDELFRPKRPRRWMRKSGSRNEYEQAGKKPRLTGEVRAAASFQFWWI